jgi:hypothetical protein
MIAFIEATMKCWRAEGGAFTVWLPVYMRADPFEEARREVEELRARIDQIEPAEQQRREERKHPVRCFNANSLSAAERAKYAL